MEAAFLKKVGPKNRGVSFDIQKASKQNKSRQDGKKKNLKITKEDLTGFQFIGVFDKKVIVTYHNHLQIFAYFDFHAIHERIRYEFYRCKIIGACSKSPPISAFDLQAIQKEGKEVKEVFGEQIKMLIQVSRQHAALFEGNEKKTQIWGIQLQRNVRNEVYVTSFKRILGRSFSQLEILCILKQKLTGATKRVPQVIDDWIAEYSCKSAYKFNDTITRGRAVLLIQNLSKCEFPWFCVHGRNTIHISSAEQLTH